MIQAVRSKVAVLADRAATLWLARRPGASVAGSAEPDLERRLQAIDTRIEHLEAALEGLQDALYRQAVREDETRADLRARTEPGRIARELSADARRRGL